MFPNVQPRNANKFLNKTLVEGTDQEAIDEETGEWYIVTTPATRKIGERMAKMNNTKQFHINIIKIRYFLRKKIYNFSIFVLTFYIAFLFPSRSQAFFQITHLGPSIAYKVTMPTFITGIDYVGGEICANLSYTPSERKLKRYRKYLDIPVYKRSEVRFHMDLIQFNKSFTLARLLKRTFVDGREIVDSFSNMTWETIPSGPVWTNALRYISQLNPLDSLDLDNNPQWYQPGLIYVGPFTKFDLLKIKLGDSYDYRIQAREGQKFHELKNIRMVITERQYKELLPFKEKFGSLDYKFFVRGHLTKSSLTTFIFVQEIDFFYRNSYAQTF